MQIHQITHNDEQTLEIAKEYIDMGASMRDLIEWEYGHSSGYSEVAYYFEDLVELL